MDHVPLPEPIFTETVTDLDGVDRDVEWELNASHLRAVTGAAYGSTIEAEAEWLLTSYLGFRLETQLALVSGDFRVAGTAGASWKLLRDLEHDWYAQLELVMHTLHDDPIVDPGLSPYPLALDLRGGHRAGWLTVRAGIGVAASLTARGVAPRGSLALLTGFDREMRVGFWGLEVEADGARPAPLVVALNLVPNLAAIGLPFRLGFAIPWNVGAEATRPSIGFYVRVFFESEREKRYAREGHE